MNELIGTQIGSYRLERVVGKGTTGTVYRATDGKRPFAVKLIHPHIAGQPAFREAVLEQTETLTNYLRHTNIAQVQQLGRQNDHFYVASAWVQGDTLGAILTTQPSMSLATAGKIAIQIAEALVFAHRQGIVHGGLHPGNVILTGSEPWQAKLTDFYITSLLEGRVPTALLAYMAPEQASGQRVSARADIYALGVMLYQMATGQLPFKLQTAAAARETKGVATPPQAHRAEIPTSFSNLILQATSRSIAGRYRSMEELLAALRREVPQLPHTVTSSAHETFIGDMPELEPEPEPAPPPPPPTPPPPQKRRQTPPEQPDIVDGEKVLVINQPGEQPFQFPIGRKWLITVGQMDGNDLVLPAEGVSPKHARLELRENGEWQIVDMNSRLGTRLEHTRLLPDVPEEWRTGQQVEIGPYRLTWGDGVAQSAPIRDYVPPAPPSEPPPPPQPKLSLTQALEHIIANPGEPAKDNFLTLKNESDTLQAVRLTVEDVPPSWVTLEAGTIYLLSRQQVDIPLVIEPPRHASSHAGQQNYLIRARSRSGITAVCQGHLTVLPYSQYWVETDPIPLRHSQKGAVLIHNEGNASQRYAIVAEDVAKELVFEPAQTEVVANAGETQVLPFLVKAKQPAFLQARIAPFELHLREGDRPHTVRERALLSPIALWPLIALLLLLFIFAIWGWRSYLCGREDISLLRNPRFNEEKAGAWFCGGMDEEAVAASPTATPTAVVVEEPTVTIEPTAAVVDAPTTAPATAVPASTAEKILIGHSVNEVEIYAYAFGSGSDAIVFVGGIHYGYAPASADLAQNLINHFEDNPPEIAAIPPNITLYIIPNMNPDSPLEPGNKDARLNANKVNLNNNWPCEWERGELAGSGALSEPESEAVYGFLINQVDTKAVIFWNTPSTATNQLKVSPGRCTTGQEELSTSLMNTYAGAISSYTADQADSGNVGGDASNALANADIPSIFVLLDSFTTADENEHLIGLKAVLQAYAR